MVEISNTFLILVPIVIGLVEMIKRVGLKSRYAGLVSVGLGIGGAALLGGPASTIVLGGIVVGLSAAGLYSSTRSTFNM